MYYLLSTIIANSAVAQMVVLFTQNDICGQPPVIYSLLLKSFQIVLEGRVGPDISYVCYVYIYICICCRERVRWLMCIYSGPCGSVLMPLVPELGVPARAEVAMARPAPTSWTKTYSEFKHTKGAAEPLAAQCTCALLKTLFLDGGPGVPFKITGSPMFSSRCGLYIACPVCLRGRGPKTTKKPTFVASKVKSVYFKSGRVHCPVISSHSALRGRGSRANVLPRLSPSARPASCKPHIRGGGGRFHATAQVLMPLDSRDV